MADRTVRVRLTADTDGYTRSVLRAAAATELLAKQADRIDGRTVRMRFDLDTNRIAAAAAGLTAVDRAAQGANVSLGRAAGQRRGISALAASAALLTPAVVGLAGPAAAAVVGLTTALGSAALGAGVAVAAFDGIGGALDAMRTYSVDPTAENLAALEASMSNLTEAGRRFVRVADGLRPALRELRDTAQTRMLPGVTDGLEDLATQLPRIETLVGNVAGAMGQLAREGGQALAGPFWSEYIDFLSAEAGPALVSFGRSIGNVIQTIAGLQMAFDPFTDDLLAGLERLTAGWADWAANLDTNERFQAFLEWVREVGPKAWDALTSIGDALLAVAEAAAPFAGPALDAITELADAFAAIMRSPVGPVLVAAAGGLAAVALAAKGARGVRGLADDLLLVTGRAGKTGPAVGAVGRHARQARGGVGLFRGTLLLLAADMVTGGYLSRAVDEYTSYTRLAIDGLLGDARAQRELAQHEVTQLMVGTGARAVVEAIKLSRGLAVPLVEFGVTAAGMARDVVGTFAPNGLLVAVGRWVAGAEQPAVAAGDLIYGSIATAVERVEQIATVPITLTVLAATEAALGAVAGVFDAAQARAAIIALHGDNSPALAAFDAAVAAGNAARSIATHDADPAPALAAINAAVAVGMGAHTQARHSADTAPARGAIAGAQAYGNQAHSSSVHRVAADIGAALGAIGRLQRTTYSTHVIRAVTVGATLGRAEGGLIHDLPGYHVGGRVTGPGTSTSDSILARLSAGEYVVRAATVREQGVDRMAALNAGRAAIVPTDGPSAVASAMQPVNTPTSVSVGWSDRAIVHELRENRRAIDNLDVRIAQVEREAERVREGSASVQRRLRERSRLGMFA